MKIFTLIYFLLALLIYLSALPFLLLFSFKKKYTQSIPARFFLYNNPPFEKNSLWFHACSLGEVRALKPLIEIFKDKDIAISTTTTTGYEEAGKYQAFRRYLPFELFVPFWVSDSKVVVILEAEFWYLFFAVVKSRGAKLILLNARISTKSYPKYKKMAWFYKKMFAYVDMIFVQSADDKKRFLELGAKNIVVSGNIKLAQKIEVSKQYEKRDIEVVVAASTHEGEEELIIDAFKASRVPKSAQLIVVPRHPERFDDVWALMLRKFDKEYALARWSEVQNFSADVILIDSIGELNNIYNISDIAILGGAFSDNVGGHNPLEPAHFGCKIISGEHYFNQGELFKYVENLTLTKEEDLVEVLKNSETIEKACIRETIDLNVIKKYINLELENV